MVKKPYAFGVDLGGTKIQILKVEEDGNVLEKVKIPTEVEKGADHVIAAIASSVEKLFDKQYPPEGIGLGVAGQVEKSTGAVLFAPNLKWSNVPLTAILKERLGFPVFATNDVRAATIGELSFGAGKNAKDLLSIFVGTGIGGAIVINGRIVSGPENTAGEIGHMIVDLNGPPCTCGSRGCLEAIAAGWGMEAKARNAVNNDPVSAKRLIALAGGDPMLIKGKIIQEAAREKDPLALSIIKEGEAALIAATASLINILNPTVVLFGGGIIDANPDMVRTVEEGARKKALKAASRHVEFRLSSLKNEAGAFGAAALVFGKG
ncbi:ROK family protein [Estrella lausannensis]|uniref:ROK family protein n=1 Tax=Estrella lausannensis TaxID=483423 RepID=A0A0H5E6U2_9BACT|nr:ROK family protein [Estrella lausannensis]CRX39010.1 ROK family protein [Estrella lausannensis]